MMSTNPVLATRIVDAIFDQWEADHGLTKSKAIDRVDGVLAVHFAHFNPQHATDPHPKPPCDEEQSPYIAGPFYVGQRGD